MAGEELMHWSEQSSFWEFQSILYRFLMFTLNLLRNVTFHSIWFDQSNVTSMTQAPQSSISTHVSTWCIVKIYPQNQQLLQA